MSTIIDALKRSDRERQINTTHTMSYSHLNAEHNQTKIWIKYVLITLLVSAVGIFIISSWFDKYQPATKSTQVSENTKAYEVASSIKVKEPEITVAKAQTPIVEAVIPETSTTPVTQKPNSALVTLVKPVDKNKNEELVKSRTSLSTLVSVPAPVPQVNVIESNLEAEEIAELTQTLSQQALQEAVILAEDFTGYDSYSSIRVSQNLPDLHLDILKYHSDKLQRKAFINMQAYKEGEQISEGAELLQIGKKGVLLRYQGTDFVLRTQ